MSPANVMAMKVCRGIVLLFRKLPKWLNITLFIVIAILPSFILTPLWAICIGFLVLVVYVSGRETPEAFLTRMAGVKKKAGYTMKYLGGLPSPLYTKPVDQMTVRAGNDGIGFKQFMLQEVIVPYQAITKIEAETRTQITRTASMFKGATGLVLAGPLGAMVGMGIGSKHDDSQNFVSIQFKDEEGQEGLIVLQQAGILSKLNTAYEVANGLREARKSYLSNQK